MANNVAKEQTICQYCKRTVTRTSNNQKYCKRKKCQRWRVRINRWNHNLYAGLNPLRHGTLHDLTPFPTRNCKECNKEFKLRHWKHIFCSRICASKFHHRRRKQRELNSTIDI